MKPFICLITGPAGVGKSTIAELLCKEYEKTARIDTDTLRYMIKNGKVHAFPYTEESKKQLKLGSKNSCDLAKNFCKAGFIVFIDDVVTSKSKLDFYIDELKDFPFKVILLLSNEETLVKRDSFRPKHQQMGKRATELLKDFEKRSEEDRWIKIDTTDMSSEDTVKHILELLN